MAHHQQTNHDRMHAALAAASVSRPVNGSSAKHAVEEEEPGDVDEPPDDSLQFSKIPTSATPKLKPDTIPPLFRQASLLTQALVSPDLTPLSDVDAPHLTSDGGLTSPARTTTPSPPLPAINNRTLPILLHEDSSDEKGTTGPMPALQKLGVDRSQEVKVEEGLGRRRCISFACSQRPATAPHGAAAKAPDSGKDSTLLSDKPARPCMLRFVCPTKPTRTQHVDPKVGPKGSHTQPEQVGQSQSILVKNATQHTVDTPSPAKENEVASISHPDQKENQQSPPTKALDVVPSRQARGAQPFNRVDYQKSEATRFHEFAGSFTEDEEWTKEQTAYREKITINDTLRKENAIRQLGEEAEAEALDEEADGYDDDEAGLEDLDELDEISDGGNETDDEEGFAESDDESDGDYQFWTPGLTTAATSTDQMEHLRPLSHRLGSESSIESVLDANGQRSRAVHSEGRKRRRSPYPTGAIRIHAPTPDLPDSSDFVVGTIDEDRPLEERYMSRRKRREQLKQKLIPQDIDPSFPNSDPEAENDEDDELDEEDEVDDDGSQEGSENESSGDEDRVSRKESPGGSDDDQSDTQNEPTPRITRNIRQPSPRRLRSPPPTRCLFGRATHRLRSPPPQMHRKLSSPPSSRRASPNTSSHTAGVQINRLAQRPNLTHTTSLPRTPNPFWTQHRKTSFYDCETPSAENSSTKDSSVTTSILPSLPLAPHSRGPIDIAQGHESKRQRRKEKFWRQHTKIAHAGKDKEKKCQPGKGAQRMRELGLEMADRFKAYKQDATGQQLVLSI